MSNKEKDLKSIGCMFCGEKDPMIPCLDDESPVLQCEDCDRRIDVPKEYMTSYNKVIEYWNKVNKLHDHKGFNTERLKHNPIEKSISELWCKENDIRNRLSINHGRGILQDLMLVVNNKNLNRIESRATINERDRKIVATIVQWLGSNIGRWFLETAFKNAGYRLTITKIEKEKNE